MNIEKYRTPSMDSTFIGPEISEYISDNISFSCMMDGLNGFT